MIKMHCNGPECEKTTNPEEPAFGWRKVELLSPLRVWGDDGILHFCSPDCEVAQKKAEIEERERIHRMQEAADITERRETMYG